MKIIYTFSPFCKKRSAMKPYITAVGIAPHIVSLLCGFAQQAAKGNDIRSASRSAFSAKREIKGISFNDLSQSSDRVTRAIKSDWSDKAFASVVKG
jgi:hypothetical protein